MKEYDYKAIPYKERLTTLCGIALNAFVNKKLSHLANKKVSQL